MKCLCIAIILCFANQIYADDIVVQISNGFCSPNINNTNGIVTVNCNDPVLTEKIKSYLPSLETYNENIKALKDLESNVNKIGKAIGNFELGLQFDKVQELKREKKSLLKSNEELKRISLEQQQLRDELSKEFAGLQEEIGGKIKQSMALESSRIANELNKMLAVSNMKIYNDIDLMLQENQNEIDYLNLQLGRLSSDVSYLMAEYHKGKLNKNIFFYGFSIGGWEFKDNWNSHFTGELEIIMPKDQLLGFKGSAFLELVHLEWEEKNRYTTLAGLPDREVIDSHDMTCAGLGLRVFAFSWPEKKLYSVISASVGHTVEGDEDTFYYSVGCAVEYVRRSVRIAFELQWEIFQSITRTEVTFSPFGDAEINSRQEQQSGIYIGMRLSFN